METQYKNLLHLLGAYLREDTPALSPDADWKKLAELAKIHSVVGILGYMSMKHPICPDPEIASNLRNLCKSTVVCFTRRIVQAQILVQKLENAGIDHILMKGYVLRDFYPVPELRTFNDIDLVIRPDSRAKSDGLMLSLGYQRHDDWEPVFSYQQGDLLFEVHTDIMEIDVSDNADYRSYFQNMWDYVRPVSAHSYRFTPEFHFLYLLTHIAKHVHGSGAGIRMYLDIAAFIRHYGNTLNWDWINAQLTHLKLDIFAAVVLTAMEHWFGVPCPTVHAEISPEVMTQFLHFTMEAGVFGHHNRDEALSSLKHTSQEEPASRIRQVIHEVFPGAKTIENRYTYLQEKPWLLPAAWVHRLVKNRDRLGLRTKKIHSMLHADTDEIQKLHQLMQDIGLS